MMGQETRAFLEDEFLSLSVMATAQRNRLYSDNATPPMKEKFRQSLRRSLKKMAKEYNLPVSGEAHCRNIEGLSNDLSTEHKGTLRNCRFRIGSAQKALNLYLKYLWCIGWINQPPPHCPFDFQIVKAIAMAKVKWTQLDSMAEYQELVEAAASKAGSLGLAEWELQLYNTTRPI